VVIDPNHFAFYNLFLMSVSLFESKDLPLSLWKKILDRAHSIKNNTFKPDPKLTSKSVGMLFFEPSSRTRWSFEKACLDLKIPSMVSIVDGSTSKSKGETQIDSLDLYLELGFDLVVVRVGSDQEVLKKLREANLKTSFINAGFGGGYHPTQALLDYFTWTNDTSANVSKILIMGDVAHSRVAKSHLRFSKIMSYQVGLLPAPGLELGEKDCEELKPDVVFTDRAEALKWAEVVMSLRTQKERHSEETKFTTFEALSSKELSSDHIIMHPGPFIRGEDLEEDLIKDSRSLIFKQKRNGVHCRAALISCLLEENNKNKNKNKKDGL